MNLIIPSNSRKLYIIGPKKGPVKIGTSKNPKKRIAELQTGNPHRLYVIAECNCCSDTVSEETQVHNLFRSDRLEGEWFERSERIQLLIDLMMKTNYDILTAIKLYGEFPEDKKKIKKLNEINEKWKKERTKKMNKLLKELDELNPALKKEKILS